MSWSAARDEAIKLVDRLQLKNDDIAGKRLDLDELFKDLEHVGRYRVMVLEAASRILENRGAKTNIREIAARHIPPTAEK